MAEELKRFKKEKGLKDFTDLLELFLEKEMLNKKFELRDYLIDLKPLIENQYLVDGFPHSYCIYTNSIPILSPYSNSYQKNSYLGISLRKKDKKKYFLVKEMRDKSNKIIYNSNFTFLDKKHLKFYDLRLYQYK